MATKRKLAMSSAKLPSWNLNDLIDTRQPNAIDKAFNKLRRAVRNVQRWDGKLSKSMSAERFRRFIKTLEKVEVEYNRLYAFTDMKLEANNIDQEAIALSNRFDEIATEIYIRTLFFETWWQGLDSDNAKRLVNSVKDVRYWLLRSRASKVHTLSEDEEKLIAFKNEIGSQTLVKLYKIMTGKLSFIIKVDGHKKTVNQNGVEFYCKHPDPNVRRSAYHELFRAFESIAPSLSLIYTAIAQDWQKENVVTRKYLSPISARNFENDISDEIIELILKVIEKHNKVYQRYLRIKARYLKSERLNRCDLYAPLVRPEFVRHFSFGEAKKIVVDAFNEFSEEFGRIVQKMFDENHVDAQIRPGKSPGSSSWSGEYKASPWIMLNFQKKADDVINMAHELGHAIHSFLSEKNGSALTADPSLVLSETASLFSEILVSEYLMRIEKNSESKKYLAGLSLDNIYHMVIRQGLLTIWEKMADNLVKNQATTDQMADEYLKFVRKNMGKAIDVPDEFKWEWLTTPLLYEMPFYVCSYSFGQLLAIALYRKYKQDGQDFKDKFYKILSAGGSDSPEQILNNAGINIRSRSFWQGGFKEISRMIDELELLFKKS